jgi:hypothetical protein
LVKKKCIGSPCYQAENDKPVRGLKNQFGPHVLKYQ